MLAQEVGAEHPFKTMDSTLSRLAVLSFRTDAKRCRTNRDEDLSVDACWP